MRKVMHHSEEIYLFVLINKLTTHFISEPPHANRIMYFLGLPDLVRGYFRCRFLVFFEKLFLAFAIVTILLF